MTKKCIPKTLFGLIILIVSVLVGLLIPPIPRGQARLRPTAVQLTQERPGYARCTHHAGLNPAVFAYSSKLIWESENDYQAIRAQFLQDRGYDPNLARIDPAWSDYDLLKRTPLSLSALGLELMNAATLNYRYIEKDAQQVVTSRTWVVCIDSKWVRSTQTAVQAFISGGRSEFDE